MHKHLATVAAVLLLSSCGGGDEEPVTGASVRKPLAAAPLTVAAVTPEQAATQLMDFAEAQFPQYFPSHQANVDARPALPLVYRHYAQTGVYLGVVVEANNLGYPLNSVIALGGPAGAAPLYLGLVTDFITPTVPGTAASNGCYDMMLSLAEVPGTHTVVVHESDSLPGGLLTTDFTTLGPTTFEGHAVVETLMRTAGGAFPSGLPAGGDEFRQYEKKTGPAEITVYGRVATLTIGGSGFTSTSSSRSVSLPPWVEKGYSVPLGGTVSMSTTDHDVTTTTISVFGVPQLPTVTNTQTARSLTVKFVRREPVTVPAGSFNACVFEMTDPAAPNELSTTWVADGKGFPLKTVATYQGTVSTQVTRSIQLNGQPVTN